MKLYDNQRPSPAARTLMFAGIFRSKTIRVGCMMLAGLSMTGCATGGMSKPLGSYFGWNAADSEMEQLESPYKSTQGAYADSSVSGAMNEPEIQLPPLVEANSLGGGQAAARHFANRNAAGPGVESGAAASSPGTSMASGMTAAEVAAAGALTAAYDNAMHQGSAAQPASATSRFPTILEVESEQQFEQIVRETTGPVLVDFHAVWCGPCKRQGHILHGLEPTAAQYGAKIVKVDVDQLPGLAKKFRVKAMPTLVVLHQGHVTQRQTGVASKAQLTQWISH